MLVQFTLKNYKCFKDEVKFSLIASNYDKSTRAEDNTFVVEKFGLSLLKSAVLYGANASGKTKLVEGLKMMKSLILSSSKEGQVDEPIGMTPFLLNTETENAPTTFEIIFIHKNELYRYGFEIDNKVVHAEWLYHRPKTKETELFYRDYQKIELNKRKFKVNDLVENDRIRPNALLLSVAANWNDKLAVSAFEWLKDFNIASGLDEIGYIGHSVARMDSDNQKHNLINFLKTADLGIENVSINKDENGHCFGNIVHLAGNLDRLMNEMPDSKYIENTNLHDAKYIKTHHKKYDKNNLPVGTVEFSMGKDESSGTKKYFALSGPILETLEKGEILFIDEMANKLHPNLTHKLIQIFNSKQYNPNNAQLIFTTHDTNFLSSNLFRRDQIWFIEKDRYGAASLYSLADFKSDTVRKEDNFEKNYLKGKYGAVPYLGDFKKSLTH